MVYFLSNEFTHSVPFLWQEMEVDSDDEDDTGLENFPIEDDLFSQEEPRTSRRLEPLSN